MRVEFLTAAHCLDFSGEMPQYSMRGVSITESDEVLAICCTLAIQGRNFIICNVADGVSKRLIVKGWGIFSQMLREDVTYYALLDKDIPSAPGFLKHFGFEQLKDDIYVYRGR